MKRPLVRRVLVVLAVLAALGLVLALVFRPRVRHAGTPRAGRVPAATLAARAAANASTVPAGPGRAERTVLFGDLHVHTTFSTDAFAWSLPLVHGEGAHPAADACDFARHCSGLDFFAITDHAESLTPRRWEETRRSIRECNAAAGDPRDPDVVAFTGFEWTQVGLTRDTHYGHRNVVFRDDADAALPARPIAAGGKFAAQLRGPAVQLGQVLRMLEDFGDRQEYLDWNLHQRETVAVPECARGVDTRALPGDCREFADTPRELHEKLAQWGFPVLSIPHGTTWGIYTPPGTTWQKQLTREHTDPEREVLFEIYSGHGNSEELRAWKEVELGDGSETCPEPSADYEPCCRRAGELIRERCGDASPEECERRVREAERLYLAAGAYGHHTVPGSAVEDWKDCGQCRDCYQPAFNYRPGNSAQGVLATTDFSDPAAPRNHPFGFIASSDNHKARPGTGYKPFARRSMTEATGPVDDEAREIMAVAPEPSRPATARAVDPDASEFANGFSRMEFERSSSFFFTGGLVAVHAEGRSREAIWEALRRREVYATSGERILLWFSLQNAPGGEAFMGREVQLEAVPRFTARALGSFEEQPGCPAGSVAGLGAEEVERLCRGECHHPGDRRRTITRIEVVRIRPQKAPGEALAPLVEDPWLTLPCSGDPAGCTVSFEDPEYPEGGRDTTYYVRAIQEPTAEINADTLRCERDAAGECLRSRPCYADYRTPMDDDCLGPSEERAWSSPIFVRQEARP